MKTAARRPGLGISFAWLNVTQFLGALNDNVFRALIAFFVLASTHETDTAPDSVLALTTAVFVIPFLLFSHAGGVLADRFGKRDVIVSMKVLEATVMALGLLAVGSGSAVAGYATIFLMSTQSALFGPSKYGVIPELVDDAELSRANARLVGLTYLAIIAGTFLPSLMLDRVAPDNYVLLAGMCVGVAGAGVLASLGIRRTPAQRGTRRFTLGFAVDLARTFRRAARDRELLLALVGAAYFLFLAGYIQQNIVLYAQAVLEWDWKQSGYLFPIAAVGIGVGALLAGALSGRNIEFGVVPIGALGLTLHCVVLAFGGPLWWVALQLFGVGVSSGLFIVPLNAFIQHRVAPEVRGEVLALSSAMSFLGVLASAALVWTLGKVPGFTPGAGFALAGGLTIVLTVVAIRALPDFLVRFVGLLVTRAAYRMRVFGMENLPREGAALLAPNHVTWVDALLISALTQRRVRFVMYRTTYEHARYRWLLDIMRVIPIAGEDSPRRLVESIRLAREALEAGYLVCIFPEGALSRNGNLRAFKGGYARILRGLNVPLVPIHIGGAWGSIFSHYHGKPLTSVMPRRMPYPVTINIGEALPPTTPPHLLRLAVSALGGEAIDRSRRPGATLARLFVHAARRNWRRQAMNDSTGRSLTYGRLLVSALVLRARLRPLLGDDARVGILMPASVGGALLNLAVTLAGRTGVNLNFTSGESTLRACIRQAELRTILTSRAFLAKLEGFPTLEGMVYIEDLVEGVSGREKVAALLAARLLPAGRLLRGVPGDPHGPATIIFSSGSTAEPKGVVLSHHNIASNVKSFSTLLRFCYADNMAAALPFFHSFGYTVTLWGPIVCGFSVSYHPNPLDSAGIAQLVRTNRSTIFLATPTFLLAYLRRIAREDFATLRYVVAGAEKLKKRVADAFEERFGLRPLEGYGATELSPVVSVNLPDVENDDLGQVGMKEGAIGHPIPGVTVRVVDIESGEILPYNHEGLVQVKGPNVMLGYLGDPARTATVVRDGWYDTGDVGRMDEDGFVFLVDRLARFSKIGGEMVPHMAVEDKLHAQLGATQQVLAIVSIPDERKGEQLALLYTPEAGDADSLVAAIAACDMPNLWKPRREHFVRLETIPVLGSGKLDLKALKTTAAVQLGVG